MKTSCFAAVFKVFSYFSLLLEVLLLFSNCLRCFSRILTNFRFFSEIFQKFFRNFWNISEKFMNPEIFCCQRFKNEWKLAVLLLFSKFSASFSYFWQFPGTKGGGKLAVLLLFSNFVRCFSRILTNFRIFSEFFQKFLNWNRKFSDFFRNFAEFFQKFLKNFWKFSEKFLKNFWNISEKFMNPEIFCCQRFKNEWKLAVLLLFSKFSASFSLLLEVLLLFSNCLRCFSRILTNFRFFSEIFQIFFRNFSEISEKILKNFWNISEKFMNPEIFCCQRFKNEWKLAVLLLFSKFSASFSYFWQVPRYQRWRKTSCFAAIFKLCALLFSNFDEFQKFFRNFSEIFQFFFRNFSEFSQKFLKTLCVAFLEFLKIFWKISEKFLKYFWKIYESRDFLLPAIQKWMKTSCFAAVFKVFS